MAQSTAIVLKGYPRLSETFIAEELRALEAHGLEFLIVSLRHPTDLSRHPVHREITAPVLYLPEFLYREPGRVLRAWRKVRSQAAYRLARAAFLKDFRHDPSPNRVRRFGQALVLAAELPESVRHLHAHFLHTPASVSRYAAMILDLKWSVSAHAVDIYTTPEWEIREKLADLEWLLTCSEANRRHLAGLAGEGNGAKVGLAYHGTHVARFAAAGAAPTGRDGGSADQPVRILSVGRLVAKKGYPDLLQALAGLSKELHWRFTHVGGGDAMEIQRLAKKLGIAERVTWRGSLPQEAVIEAYGEADIFALASRVAADGDRDGLPNVLMEAQAAGLPAVATNVSAIPELIAGGVTGLLVKAGNAAAISDALERLIRDPALRRQLGAAGAARVAKEFDFAVCIKAVLPRFGLMQARKVEKVA
ncbi:MAG: glycosyltransferase family 4 protein [Pseudomonadota bacterium]|nr:glycosyltransferase family 4 protein [Pseudomonadota bacterium]